MYKTRLIDGSTTEAQETTTGRHTHVFEELLALFLGELWRRDVTLLVALDAAQLLLEPPSLLLHLLLLSFLQ